MSETDLARSWCGAAPPPPPPLRGGDAFRPDAKEMEGRDPETTLFSARDLSCSDQLKPWSFEPGLLAPGVRMLRIAWVAPKLMWRVYGVVGAVRADVISSSSIALSSIVSELLVDRLPRRMLLNCEELVGDVPDRPSVVMERRRRWSFMAEEAIEPGKTGVAIELEFLLW